MFEKCTLKRFFAFIAAKLTSGLQEPLALPFDGLEPIEGPPLPSLE
jgi:hypothetical protein